MEVRIFDSAQLVAQAVADGFVSAASDAIRKRGTFSVALAGGHTPQAAYELLATQPRKHAVDWSGVRVFFGDERCVPPASDQSNYRMASQTLLQHVPVNEAHVFRIRGEDDPESAALQYRETLAAQLGKPPKFDLILLGMGEDGHTASLFPGADPYSNDDLFVRAVFVEKLASRRITLTPAAINNAKAVVVAVVGAQKSTAVRAVMKGALDPASYPIQAIQPNGGSFDWFLDKAAASQL